MSPCSISSPNESQQGNRDWGTRLNKTLSQEHDHLREANKRFKAAARITPSRLEISPALWQMRDKTFTEAEGTSATIGATFMHAYVAHIVFPTFSCSHSTRASLELNS